MCRSVWCCCLLLLEFGIFPAFSPLNHFQISSACVHFPPQASTPPNAPQQQQQCIYHLKAGRNCRFPHLPDSLCHLPASRPSAAPKRSHARALNLPLFGQFKFVVSHPTSHHRQWTRPNDGQSGDCSCSRPTGRCYTLSPSDSSSALLSVLPVRPP